MKYNNDQPVFTATDLSNHIACRHATHLERQRALGKITKPVRKNQFLDRIIERGNDHEAAYLAHLKEGPSCRIVEFDWDTKDVDEATQQAMEAGADVIFQGALSNAQWGGRPDFLLKVPTPSPQFGDWSYEVIDNKLTQNTKAGTIMQLCVYSELLQEIQGNPPEHMHVVMPNDDPSTPYTQETHRLNDYAAYYRGAKAGLVNEVESAEATESYPEPVSHCDICQWWPDCDKRRRDDDHLTFVAGMPKAHIKALRGQHITTLTSLANADVTQLKEQLDTSTDTTDRLYHQAKIQLKGRESGKPEFEFLPVEYPQEDNNQRRGFLRLPAPDPNGDLFFDIESARHAPGGGLEYLLGYATDLVGQQTPDFQYLWGLDRAGEKAAFEQFIDLAIAKLSEYPNMHIYHFAPYEPVALKRLATRHATREAELDILLIKQRFVDLYAVTRQSIRAGVESYSIKCLEPFYGYEREEELAEARLSMHRLESVLEMGAADKVREEDKAVVLKYNRDDCISTLALRNWLEDLRQEQIDQGVDLPRPPAPEGYTPKEEERAPEVQKVFDDLTADFRDNPTQKWTEAQKARWLLANCLDYFRREEKNSWWEYYRLRELDTDNMLKERNAITGLQLIAEISPKGKVKHPSHVYSYPEQFVTIDEGDDMFEATTDDGKPWDFKIGTVVAVDHDQRTIEIRKTGKTINKHPVAIFHHLYVDPAPMPQTLLDFAKQVAANPDDELNTAQFDLLTRRPPRFTNGASIKELDGKTQSGENTTVEQTYELVSKLNSSVLAIQGPPGTGKTFTGSHVIVRLVRAGKRIGVTAVSHKVIDNLLDRIYEASNGRIGLGHAGTKDNISSENVTRLDSKKVVDALSDNMVIGATAWTWANAKNENELDYLFIDEAGQMSLAMALTAARAAKNVVLLGDPQQLEQPQKAAHPEGSEIAALAHLIGDNQTIDASQGLFLDTTYRMHPAICHFTSEQYYEDRLQSLPGLENQRLLNNNDKPLQQLTFIPVEHTGNQSRSEEEANKISALVQQLLDETHQWTDKDNCSKPLQPKDILVVAPYNAQVSHLRNALPQNIRVGTVDKFQGQQAPVVIYSMTSSSVEDAPRGMEFLFSPNRFNVATSRAKCAVFVVGSPALVQADCKTPQQIQWVNGLCRFVELAGNHKTTLVGSNA